MDDDLETAQEIAEDDLGASATDSIVSPSVGSTGLDTDGRTGSLGGRLRKALAVLLLGRYEGVRYAGRDRLAILLRAGIGGVGLAALGATLADLIGIRSGPLWDVQVVADQLLVQAFALVGSTATYLADTPLVTLLVVLALAGIVNYRR